MVPEQPLCQNLRPYGQFCTFNDLSRHEQVRSSNLLSGSSKWQITSDYCIFASLLAVPKLPHVCESHWYRSALTESTIWTSQRGSADHSASQGHGWPWELQDSLSGYKQLSEVSWCCSRKKWRVPKGQPEDAKRYRLGREPGLTHFLNWD